jgi:hypothetical protein
MRPPPAPNARGVAPAALETPVAFLVFNRPDTTARVFAEIARARPRQLLVVADGPRPDRPGEAERCAAVRAIVERVDWPCEVRTNYSDRNLGCRGRVSSGLDWVFEEVEEAIVLEDDCLPHPTFFRYCETLIERYRGDERVTCISGDDFQRRDGGCTSSYYYSRFVHVWGWATWRRAWRHYDVTMSGWPAARDAGLLEAVWGTDRRAVAHWRTIFDAVHAGRVDTWDFQWVYACWQQGGLTVLPCGNLVSNLGFGAEATHTTSTSALAELPTREMTFPLRAPPYMRANPFADHFTQHRIVSDDRALNRFRQWIHRTLGR